MAKQSPFQSRPFKSDQQVESAVESFEKSEQGKSVNTQQVNVIKNDKTSPRLNSKLRASKVTKSGEHNKEDNSSKLPFEMGAGVDMYAINQQSSQEVDSTQKMAPQNQEIIPGSSVRGSVETTQQAAIFDQNIQYESNQNVIIGDTNQNHEFINGQDSMLQKSFESDNQQPYKNKNEIVPKLNLEKTLGRQNPSSKALIGHKRHQQMVQAYDPKTKPKNESQERVDPQAISNQVQKKAGSKSKNRANVSQSQQQVQMKIKSRESGRNISKSPNYDSQREDNLQGLISEVQGNYIKIGAVLGNVNIIHQNSHNSLQQNDQQIQHMKTDSENGGKKDSQDVNFNPYDQRQTRAGDTMLNTTNLNSKIGTKSSHKNVQSNERQNSSRSRSRGSGLTMTKKNLKNFNTSLISSNQGKRISDLQNVYNVTNNTNKTNSNLGDMGGSSHHTNMLNFDQRAQSREDGPQRFPFDKMGVVENNPADILEGLENGFHQIDADHQQQFDSIRGSDGGEISTIPTIMVNEQPQPPKTNAKVKSAALTSKQKKKKKQQNNPKSIVNNQQQQFVVNQKESKTIQDRQLKAKNLMYQTQKQDNLNKFNPVQSEENLQGYEFASMKANGNLRMNHGIYDQARTPNITNGHGDMYRISSSGIQPNRKSNLNQDSVNQSQLWDQRKNSMASQYGIQKQSFQKRDDRQDGMMLSGSIQTNFTKFDSKDEVSSAERTYGSSALTGLGGLPVIQNKKNSVFVHNTAGGAISPSQNRKSRLGRKLINNIARNKNNKSIGSNGEIQGVSNRYDQVAKSKFVSQMPNQIQEDFDKLNQMPFDDQRQMQNVSINRGNEASIKRSRPRTKQIGSNNQISQAQTSQYKYRAYKLVPVTQASLAQPIKEQRQKKNVSSSALDIRHKTPGAQSISIGNTGRVQKFQRMKQSESPNNSMIVRAANNSVQNKEHKTFNEINMNMTEDGELIEYSQIPSELRNIPQIDVSLGPLKGTPQQKPFMMDVLEGEKVKGQKKSQNKSQIDTQEFKIGTNIQRLNDYTDQNLDTVEKIDALEQQNMNIYTQSDYPPAYQNIEVQQQSELNQAPSMNKTDVNWSHNPGLMIVQQESLENAEPNQSSFVSMLHNDKEDSINHYDMNYNPNFDESFKSNDGKLRFSQESKVRKIRTKQQNSRASKNLEELGSNNPQRHGLLKPIRDSQNQWPYGANLTNSQKQLTSKGVAQIQKIQNSYFSNGDNQTPFQKKRDARLQELLQSKQHREKKNNFNSQLVDDQVNYAVDQKVVNTANITQKQQFFLNQKKQQNTSQPSPKQFKQKPKSIHRKTDRAQLSNSVNNSLINHNKVAAKNSHSTQRQPDYMAKVNYDSARSPRNVKVVQNQGHQMYSSQQNDTSFTNESQDRIININLNEQQKQTSIGAEFVAPTISSRKAKMISRETDRSGSMQRQQQRFDSQRNRSLVKDDKHLKTKAAKQTSNQTKIQNNAPQISERPNTKILGQVKKENQWNTLIAQENQKKMSKAKERRVVERLTQDQKWKQKVEENNKIQQEIEQITTKIQARKNQEFRIKMQKKLEKYHNKLEKEFQQQNKTFKKETKGSISPIRSEALKRVASPKRAESSLQKPYEVTLNDDQLKQQNSDRYEILSNYQVVQGYEARFGKADKFIRANSPIDKYYRMYVIEPESKVYGQSQRGGSKLSNQHLQGCPHANHNSRSSLENISSRKRGPDIIPLPSPERQKKATQLLESAKDVDELFMIADTNRDAMSVLQQKQLVCNCHKMGNEMITQRMSVKPSDVRSAAGSHGVFAGEAMSAHGLDFETNFRKFRSPCRKTCSTIHNPLYHCSRFGIKLSDCRPMSADKKLSREAELQKIDWLKTEINEAVRLEEAKEKQQRDLSHEKELGGQGYETSGERDQSPDDLMGGIHTERDRSATKVQRQMEDMKNIMRLIESTAQKEKAKGTLTEKEVLHYSTIMKDPALKEQLGETERGDLLTKCWKTLDFVMSSLILSKDFELLQESNEKKQENARKQLESDKIKKQEFDAIEDEFIIKALIRCEKMFDAKQEIVRILVKIKKREQLMDQFDQEREKCTDTRAKGYYFIILKLSTRIHNQIERLRVDNPMLNRPFIFNRENFQSSLVKQQLFLRDSLIKMHRHLKRDLDRVLDKSGKIVKVKVLADYNQKVKQLEDADRYENLTQEQKHEITSQLGKGHIGRLRRGTALSQMDLKDQNQSEQNMSDID